MLTIKCISANKNTKSMQKATYIKDDCFFHQRDKPEYNMKKGDLTDT